MIVPQFVLGRGLRLAVGAEMQRRTFDRFGMRTTSIKRRRLYRMIEFNCTVLRQETLSSRCLSQTPENPSNSLFSLYSARRSCPLQSLRKFCRCSMVVRYATKLRILRKRGHHLARGLVLKTENSKRLGCRCIYHQISYHQPIIHLSSRKHDCWRQWQLDDL